MAWLVLRLKLRCDIYIKIYREFHKFIIFTLGAARGRSQLVCQYLLLLQKLKCKDKVEEEMVLCLATVLAEMDVVIWSEIKSLAILLMLDI